MRLRNLRYFLVESVSCLFKNRLMGLASIITVAGCTLILCISYFIVSNLDYILESIERSMFIVAYIDDYATDDEVKELERIILEMDYVDSLTYTSSEEALANFSESLGDQEGFLMSLPYTNILPRSFDIKVNEVYGQNYVVEQLLNLRNKGIYSVLHDQDAIDTLIAFNRGIRIISILMVLFLACISTVIIINTIRVTVNARKNEINIMKYVGATDWFIRWPFILEGILIGFIGAIISLSISWVSYTRFINVIIINIPLITNLLEFRDINEMFIILIPTALIMGIGIGIIGSVTSIRKHLRV